MRRPERASSSRSETAASRSPFNLMPSVAASTTSRAPTTERAAGCLGNFDARVDYEVLEWPPTNGVAVTLNLWFTSSPAFSIDRESKAIEQYATLGTSPRGTRVRLRTSVARSGGVGVEKPSPGSARGAAP